MSISTQNMAPGVSKTWPRWHCRGTRLQSRAMEIFCESPQRELLPSTAVSSTAEPPAEGIAPHSPHELEASMDPDPTELIVAKHQTHGCPGLRTFTDPAVEQAYQVHAFRKLFVQHVVVLTLIALIICKRTVTLLLYVEDKKSLLLRILLVLAVLLVLVLRICVQRGLLQRLMPCFGLSGSDIVCVVWIVASNLELPLLTQSAKDTYIECRYRVAPERHCSGDTLFSAMIFAALFLFLNGIGHVHLILSPYQRWPSAAMMVIVFLLSLALLQGQGQLVGFEHEGDGRFAHENATVRGMHGGRADHGPVGVAFHHSHAATTSSHHPSTIATSLAALAVLMCGMLIAAVHEGAMRASYARQSIEAASLSLRNAQLAREKERLQWDVRLREHRDREELAIMEQQQEETESDPPFSHHTAKVGGTFCSHDAVGAHASGAGAQGAALSRATTQAPSQPQPPAPAGGAFRPRWFGWPKASSAPAVRCSADTNLSNLPDERGNTVSSEPASLARLYAL